MVKDKASGEKIGSAPKTAIYARKSVLREDSVSIETQIEQCGYEARGEAYTVYRDNGFSGKNTQRPGFTQMMSAVREGLISKVIVYRLDRISRSILDFSEMMETFRRYGVDFVSATEHFDTSSPMGRAMLNICVVFAQLERETIQQRIRDSYFSRSKRGLYMGGRVPYGFRKVPAVVDGINTSMYEAVPDEASDVLKMYETYSRSSATLGDVLRSMPFESGGSRRGRNWCTARISEIIRNPVYVKADMGVREFYSLNGTDVLSSPEKFDGVHGCFLFSGENTTRKTRDLNGRYLVIAPHRGIVPPDMWLFCRKKLLHGL